MGKTVGGCVGMADEIKVVPTPIQRNENDVATELTMLYFRDKPVGSAEEIQTIFVKMFAAVGAAHAGPAVRTYLKNYLPEELKK
jgi:hypothetical protein